jgi:phage terminase large subunit-like protein
MSRRQQDTSRINLTAAQAAVRRKQEAKAPELGWPLCPSQYAYNDRVLWRWWKQLGSELLKRRLLSYADGGALLRLAEAQKCGQTELCKTLYAETWGSREPFPDPKPTADHTLADFLAGVRRERETFSDRMIPTETVCRANGEVYTWPKGRPATIARTYALEVTQGKIVAGELLRRACDRFLKDLEIGHTQGIYFDPVAAAHICEFAEIFCALPLLPWQVFVLTNVFGWKKPSGARRFTEAWVSCAKKNGKTRLASCVALYALVADCEKYPDVFSAATKKEQSRLVWRDAKRCVQDNSELCAAVKRWAGALQVADTDGTFTPLSSDEKSMDGLRPHVIIADEVAFWGDREQWDKLVKGGVSRVQPLVFAVTTAGSTKNCFAFGKFDLAEKILRGIYHEPSTFVAIFSIDKEDDALDEKCWPKANPSLGVTLKTEHLHKTRDEVKQDGSGLNAWLQYHCNIWPEVSLHRVGSINAKLWDCCAHLELIGASNPLEACQKFLLLNAGDDTPMYVGIDIGLTGDTTAVAMLWPRARFAEGQQPVEKKVVIVQGFMPEENLLEKEKTWRVPLSVFARESWIDLTPGDMCDPRQIKKYVVGLHSQFTVREIGFDNWQFQVAAAELNEAGIKATAVPQTAMHLTGPSRDFLSALHSDDIVHFGNPWLAWHAGNVVFAENEKHGGCKPEKLAPNEKIDCVSAIVNAWARMLANPYVPSPYLTRGIHFI